MGVIVGFCCCQQGSTVGTHIRTCMDAKCNNIFVQFALKAVEGMHSAVQPLTTCVNVILVLLEMQTVTVQVKAMKDVTTI